MRPARPTTEMLPAERPPGPPGTGRVPLSCPPSASGAAVIPLFIGLSSQVPLDTAGRGGGEGGEGWAGRAGSVPAWGRAGIFQEDASGPHPPLTQSPGGTEPPHSQPPSHWLLLGFATCPGARLGSPPPRTQSPAPGLPPPPPLQSNGWGRQSVLGQDQGDRACWGGGGRAWWGGPAGGACGGRGAGRSWLSLWEPGLPPASLGATSREWGRERRALTQCHCHPHSPSPAPLGNSPQVSSAPMCAGPRPLPPLLKSQPPSPPGLSPPQSNRTAPPPTCGPSAAEPAWPGVLPHPEPSARPHLNTHCLVQMPTPVPTPPPPPPPVG